MTVDAPSRAATARRLPQIVFIGTLAASAAADWLLFRLLERPLAGVLRGLPKPLKPAPAGLPEAPAP